MKKDEVKVGETYLAKVSDKVVPVRLDAENPRGGWDATNMATNKKVRIKSAQRLRGKAKTSAKAEAVGSGPAMEPTPEPAKLTIHVNHDRNEGKWFWSVREGKVEHHDGDDGFDTEDKARADGEKWLKAYAKANDAARRKMLGWKPATPGDGSAAAAPATGKDAAASATEKKPARAPKATKEAKPKKLSLIDAAAQVLAASDGPLNVKQMVEQVIAQKLWTPGTGKTPSATLYSSILRELQHKGGEARFKKVDRGQFALAKGA